MAHRTLIGGTGYDAKSGRTLTGGTGYSLKKGRTLIGGTGYDISFGTPVGELDVGTSVYMDVDGVSTEFLVVHQGNPNTSFYDSTCTGTWILAKYIYALVAYYSFNASGVDYGRTVVDSYANGTFFNKFDTNIQNLIKQVNIPVNSSGDTISRKIFTVAQAEADQGSPNRKLDYFDGTDARCIAYYNGTATAWWSRDNSNQQLALLFKANGSHNWGTTSMTTTNGFRPMFILPSDDAKFDDNFNIIA